LSGWASCDCLGRRRLGKIAPAPWVPYTTSGCDFGAFSTANIEFENIAQDVNTVFGPNSPEAQETKSNPTKAAADFLGIAIHCARNSFLCNNSFAKPDLLPDEPGGYAGFNALYGNQKVRPVISPGGPVLDLDGNVITDGHSNPGFTGFSPTATQSLGSYPQHDWLLPAVEKRLREELAALQVEISPHPALGQELTPSPTARRAQAGTGGCHDARGRRSRRLLLHA
jgi:hypothetical protein